MNGRGVQVGRVLGVPIVVQPLWFLVVLAFSVGFEPTVRDHVDHISPSASYAVALLFVLLLYASVLIHELSHLAVAKALGMQVQRLVLQFFGGATEVVEEQPGKPSREYLVAAVGPLTSLLLGGVGLAVAPLFTPGGVPRLLADGFGGVNLFVAAFNALPGLPLDGGRVLRAFLWQITHDKSRGTIISGWIGRGLAVGLFALGAFEPRMGGISRIGPIYAFLLAAYLWFAASMSIGQARVTSALPRLDLSALTRRALPVAADLPVAEAVRRARDADARALVVVDGAGKPQGIVSEAAVGALPVERQPWVAVSDLARPIDPGIVLRMTMDGAAVLDAVQTTPATEYLVVDAIGAVRGVLARVDVIAALQAAGVR
jgi:Zn-dependent protease/CBS domain-containing protein